jgi:predicted regulator of amino acid metabolism with ACT domain
MEGYSKAREVRPSAIAEAFGIGRASVYRMVEAGH